MVTLVRNVIVEELELLHHLTAFLIIYQRVCKLRRYKPPSAYAYVVKDSLMFADSMTVRFVKMIQLHVTVLKVSWHQISTECRETTEFKKKAGPEIKATLFPEGRIDFMENTGQRSKPGGQV
ncbi:hypothetical protein CEXT_159551 [Caerostris extrusa]|uniref:Uncharacterized protein n=1 Tax=Caerostris extrusa TaxID=172846 RepID=A0AAV4T068_CAEEX|nr:hypothetical protein CEXT_159551 [Caerostris extrusa]